MRCIVIMTEVKHRHLLEYTDSLRNIRLLSVQKGIRPEEFARIYNECLNDVYMRPIEPKNTRLRSYCLLVIIILSTLVVLLHWKGICSLFLCNIQECIYPGLKILRKLSIPVIKMFPSLTDFYDESCLIQNPYFQVVDMDCWPCESVDKVVEIRDPVKGPINPIGEPYLYKTDQEPITAENLQEMYKSHRSVFDKDASKILVNNKEYSQAGIVLGNLSTMNINNNYVWRMNRIGPAQQLRKLIPRPAILPRLGLSTERFLIIEGGDMSWKMPDPECNNVFVLQASGERTIELSPASECMNNCKPIILHLPQSYLLIYNWWYWRPISRSTSKNNATSIILMGSYC